MKKGDRCGAVICAEKETKIVRLAGFGVYQGDEIPPKGITFMGCDLNEMQHRNPRIDLDNGKTIWGCQCWWGSEGQIKKTLAQYEASGYKIECEGL